MEKNNCINCWFCCKEKDGEEYVCFHPDSLFWLDRVPPDMTVCNYWSDKEEHEKNI